MQIAKEHIRQNILNAALPLFYAKGYSKVTIREIADDSHVGLSNIYNYYNSKENIYIQSIKIDGKPYDKTYLTHEQIMSGATVEFEMSNTPKAIGVIFEDKNP